jgi:very-short-patch-repair endonuclease
MDIKDHEWGIQSIEPGKNRMNMERILWFYLRNHQLMNMKFERQVPIGTYTAEFICDEKKLIIEVDEGREALHPEPDSRRDRWIEGHGFKILRFCDHEVLENIEGVIYAILECGGEL